MRVIGMDIHRVFAEAVALLDGKVARLGRVDMRRDRLEAFARSALTHDDHVVVEATGNAAAVAEVLAPHVGRVVIANPKQVRLIAHAKVKTDAIDAAALAKLYASGFLPEVWVPDERTAALRRQVSRREQLVRQRTRLKNIVQSILHAHLVPPARTPTCSAPAVGLGWPPRRCPRTSGWPWSGTSEHWIGCSRTCAWSSATSPGTRWRTRASGA